MTESPEHPAGVERAARLMHLVEALGLPAALVDIVAADELLQDPAVLQGSAVLAALRAGVLSAVPGGVRVSEWCRDHVAGAIGPSRGLYHLSAPVPRVASAESAALLDLLLSTAGPVEVVAPERSVAAAHAAWAVGELGLEPLLLDLRHLDLMGVVPGLVAEIALQSKVLGLGPVLLIAADVAADPEFYLHVQFHQWPMVVVVDRQQRRYTPRDPFATVTVGPSSIESTLQAWEHYLDDLEVDGESMAGLAAIPLSVPQMYEVFVRARSAATARSRRLAVRDVLEHAAEMSLEGTGHLAEVRQAVVALDELVFPSSLGRDLAQLIEAAGRLSRLPPTVRRGLRAIFAGPSGTGKTAAAEAVAAELGAPIVVADLSRIVDKYIGETEKNLDRVLSTAQESGSVLLFDEGEALFSTRDFSAGSGRSHFANMQAAYLLSRMERHDGVVILCTNLSGAIDAAFSRRFHYQLRFTPPDRSLRPAVWRRVMARFDIGQGVDVDALAVHELTAGNIYSICYLAALLGERERPDQELLDALVQQEFTRLARRQ